ncbi:MAG TPA: hypothetical protein P5315_04485 [Clostridia bacterium]|nr:hypothetical protein [Clostridia bacterium]
MIKKIKGVSVRILMIIMVFAIVFSTACKVETETVDSGKPTASATPASNQQNNNDATETPDESVSPSEPPAETNTPETETPDPSSEPADTSEPVNSSAPITSEEPVTSQQPDDENDLSYYSRNLFPIRPHLSLNRDSGLQYNLAETAYLFEFANPIELYSSTGPGKPSYLPGSMHITIPSPVLPGTLFTNEPPVYTNGFRSSFVQKDGDEVLWFAWKSGISGVSSVVWQISDRPFSNNKEEYENPPGLLKSGTLAANVKEFSIDFSKLGNFNLGFGFTMPGFSIITPVIPTFTSIVDEERVNPEQKIYYVRAFAKDSSGRIIGEPGKGLEIIYGDRVDYVPNFNQMIVMPFELLFGAHNGPAGPQNEFYNTFLDTYERTYVPGSSGLLYFRPEGMPSDTDTILIQVCTSQPGYSRGNWRDPAGLVYEVMVKKGEADFDNLTDEDHGIAIDVNAFAKSPPANYYVRAVALSDGPVAGTVKDSYSKSVLLNYGEVDSQFEFIPPPEVIYLDAGIPDLRLLEYHHHYDADPEWMYYFEVVRQPTYSEYYALMPSMFVNNPNGLVEGMTPGTVIYTKPKEEDDGGWWDKVKDAISDVFGSIKNFVASVTNWVSSAYADLKSGMIAFVAENMPLVPDEFRDDLKKALETMVDSGLASMGIPPELPNFDQLTSMGADYLAATALQQAGIPANEWTKDMVKDLGEGIAESAVSSASSGNSPNPFNWNFVRQYPGKMYQPAHILIELTNNTNKVSPSGTLSGKVFANIQSSELSDPNKMTLSSTFGGTLYFELYRPVHGMKIPELQPGQTMEIPIFLEKYTGMAYSFNPHVVTEVEFGRLYSQIGEYTFSFIIDYDLPPVDEYAADLGLEPKGRYHVYEYKESADSFGFTRVPWENIN